jgi:hypothetical protein
MDNRYRLEALRRFSICITTSSGGRTLSVRVDTPMMFALFVVAKVPRCKMVAYNAPATTATVGFSEVRPAP